MLTDRDVKNINKNKNKSGDDCYMEQEQKNEKSSHVTGEEKPSVLNFSRENLTLLQSNMEQGFNKQSPICSQIINRHTILNMCTIILAISCIFFEIFKLPKVLENSRNIEMIKRDLEALQRQFYEENFLNEFKEFEKQLYDNDDDDDASVNDNDSYDNYDDDQDYDKDQRDYDNIKEINTPIVSTTPSAINKNIEQVFNYIKNNRTGNESAKLSNNNSSVTINKDTKEGSTDSLSIRQKRSIGNSEPSKKFICDHEIGRLEGSTTVGRRKRQYMKTSDEAKMLLVPRASGKRNVRVVRQIFAAHYGADSSLFAEEDEHTGNGRLRHNEGIFKAWRPSNWMNNLGMDRHFSLHNNGKLTVHETGLYLVYAQIHYLDEHDENGFHLLVNDRPILQCMVYSPGTGHKSRSCFSAQVTLLKNDDEIILKDVGISRYTLFQKDKSFFGLVKIGEAKQSQGQSSQLLKTEE